MRKRPILLTITLCLALCGTGTALAEKGQRLEPHRYQPRVSDHGLVSTINPVDGTAWSAWAYRNGAEYEIAVATSGESGIWSEPFFFGYDDGRDQTQPALAADSAGTIYLVYRDDPGGRLMLTWSGVGTDVWSSPRVVALEGQSPALRVLGQRLVVAFLAGRDVTILDLPLQQPVGGRDPIPLIIESGDPIGATGGASEERNSGEGNGDSSNDDSDDDETMMGMGSVRATGSKAN